MSGDDTFVMGGDGMKQVPMPWETQPQPVADTADNLPEDGFATEAECAAAIEARGMASFKPYKGSNERWVPKSDDPETGEHPIL